MGRVVEPKIGSTSTKSCQPLDLDNAGRLATAKVRYGDVDNGNIGLINPPPR